MGTVGELGRELRVPAGTGTATAAVGAPASCSGGATVIANGCTGFPEPSPSVATLFTWVGRVHGDDEVEDQRSHRSECEGGGQHQDDCVTNTPHPAGHPLCCDIQEKMRVLEKVLRRGTTDGAGKRRGMGAVTERREGERR
ncbi:hypothetical protein Vafri_2827 [Volvox africanus]|uniref:Uncharacterized protein n=1 Tax=Volvox africanus TaxID=51714 RepID=A0A8J4AT40_9CHLO|nr:hypothetical protein Vafri_2827 [Volvox africanus]